MSKQETRPIFIGLASQKGGVGKSTLAEVLASLLGYVEGKKILVLDCDYNQYSFYNLRMREEKLMQSDKEEDSSLQGKVISAVERYGYTEFYPVHSCLCSEAMRVARSIYEREPMDVVLVDLPGRSDAEDLLTLCLEMDYIITPLEADTQSLRASWQFLVGLRAIAQATGQGSKLRQLYGLWNKIDPRTRQDVKQEISTRLLNHGLCELFDTEIRHLSCFTKELRRGSTEVFRSTLLPPDQRLLATSGMLELMSEIKEKLLS